MRLERSAPATAPADPTGGRLAARPHSPPLPPAAAGLHPLGLSDRRDGLLYVPGGYRPEHPAPLVLMLHGAGADARAGIEPFLGLADDAGLLLVAPDSRRPTWDAITDSYGPDVAFINRALSFVFDHCSVDDGHLAIEGFSDGASYALSLGLRNGDVFSHVIAFSPGFCTPGERVLSPKIFISHGEHDRVLPIDRTSRLLIPRLNRNGYDLTYREFSGGHVVPPDTAHSALRWFLQCGQEVDATAS